jgi:hypothetical protein
LTQINPAFDRADSMILAATHTHLYPGHRGTVSGLETSADLDDRDCLVEFSDGSATTARIRRRERGWQIDTGAGTRIDEKRWWIDFENNRDRIAFRILGAI